MSIRCSEKFAYCTYLSFLARVAIIVTNRLFLFVVANRDECVCNERGTEATSATLLLNTGGCDFYEITHDFLLLDAVVVALGLVSVVPTKRRRIFGRLLYVYLCVNVI